MYDRLTCEYPIWRPDWATGFQTKDLDNLLNDYTITADGRLLCATNQIFAPDEDREDTVEQVPVDFTGPVTFYDTNAVAYGPGVYTANGEDVEEVEYRAQFKDGILDTVELVRHEKNPAAKWKPWQPSAVPDVSPERRAESLLGRTIHVWWGGQEAGYDAVVKAENDRQLVVEKPNGLFELIWRADRDNTFFDSREDGIRHMDARKAEWARRQVEYDAEIAPKIAAREKQEKRDGN